MLLTDDLDYELPPGAVATTPAEPRDSARLMVIRRGDATRIDHVHIRDLPGFLQSGDRLVLNNTRVLAARLEGVRPDTGGKVGGLYLRPAAAADGWHGPGRAWVALMTGKSLREGVPVHLTGAGGTLEVQLMTRVPADTGAWVLALRAGPGLDGSDENLLAAFGHTPLPPYIMKARKDAAQERENAADRERYQTVYAAAAGSVAAPTAGLHFTPSIFAQLAAKGVDRSEVLLHVGTGTFKSVETKFVEEHPMHSEWCSMSRATRDQILATRAAGGRVFCVGTTSARTVESFAGAGEGAFGTDAQASMDTRLLITPGYQFLWTDGLLTNFHLPRSTLLALVGAMLPEGLPRLKELYREALSRGYRFFSYGDAMLILP